SSAQSPDVDSIAREAAPSRVGSSTRISPFSPRAVRVIVTDTVARPDAVNGSYPRRATAAARRFASAGQLAPGGSAYARRTPAASARARPLATTGAAATPKT